MSSEEVFEFLCLSEQNINTFCISEFRSLFNNMMNTYLLRKFSIGFKRDEQGNNRNWKEVEEQKIKDLFEVNKKIVDDCIDECKLVGFPKNITQLPDDSFEEDFGENSRQTSSFDATDIVMRAKTDELSFKRKLSSVHYKIINEDEITSVRNKFYEDIEFSY